MAINREVKSRQIAGNSVLKVMAITFWQIATDRIAKCVPKNYGNQSRGEITANRGKSCFKSNGDHFFDKSRLIASQSAYQKTMAITLEANF